MNTAGNLLLQRIPRFFNGIVFQRIRRQGNQGLRMFFCKFIQDLFLVKRCVVHDDVCRQ